MDIDIIFRIAGVGIVVSVLSLLLKQSGKEDQAYAVTLAGTIVVLFMMVQLIGELFDLVRATFNF